MMIIETRKSAQDMAFELLDEIKDLGRKKKIALHELETTLYDCFDSSEEDDERDEYVPYEEGEPSYRRSYRHALRNMRSMRDDEDEMYHRRQMRMRRRNSMGRFV